MIAPIIILIGWLHAGQSELNKNLECIKLEELDD